MSFWRRFPELLAGSRLQGIIGPVFALCSSRLARGRAVRSVADFDRFSGDIFVPLVDECRSTFLMPAIPFVVALRYARQFSERIAAVILMLHAITSWPTIVSMYSPGSYICATSRWLRASALKRSSEYLNRTSLEYRMVKMAERHTPPNARIFDLTGAHVAYANRSLLGFWTLAGARLLEGLEFARTKRGHCSLPPLPTSNQSRYAVFGLYRQRVRFSHGASIPSISKIRWEGLKNAPDGRPRLLPTYGKLLWRSIRNLVSRWSTRKPADRGFFVQGDYRESCDGRLPAGSLAQPEDQCRTCASISVRMAHGEHCPRER